MTWLEDLVEQDEISDDKPLKHPEGFLESSQDKVQMETDWVQDIDPRETDAPIGQTQEELAEISQIEGHFEKDQVGEILEEKLDPTLDIPEFLQDSFTTSPITSDISPTEQQKELKKIPLNWNLQQLHQRR